MDRTEIRKEINRLTAMLADEREDDQPKKDAAPEEFRVKLKKGQVIAITIKSKDTH